MTLFQSRGASHFMERHCTVDDPYLINDIVLCEMAWVLEFAYDHPKGAIVEVLEKLLMTDGLEMADKNTVWVALKDYRATKADFADCLIGRINSAPGCAQTATFDKALKSLSGFKPL
jgi:predicted nucleic-acid-binding protein